MITATRRIQFCAGHRVFEHESKCKNCHGHNYVVLATAAGAELDKLGRVIDFSVIKEHLGGWIDKHWDHGFLYFKNDDVIHFQYQQGTYKDQKHYVCDFNPTAENMAWHLLEDICPTLFMGTGIKIIKIKLWETENCYAEASLIKE